MVQVLQKSLLLDQFYLQVVCGLVVMDVTIVSEFYFCKKVESKIDNLTWIPPYSVLEWLQN